MHLKHPEILWALLLLLIPLIVHLFRLRRFKKETFTNVRFLREVEQQTRKSATLKKWLVLAMRSLGFTMLILAFTGPYLGDPDTGKATTSYIAYLDNSYSMGLPSAQGTLLQNAVHQLLDQWPEDIPLQVITNDQTFGPGTKSELQNPLLSLGYSKQQLDLKDVVLKAEPLFSPDKQQKVLYLFTDLQHSWTPRSTVGSGDMAIRLNSLRPEQPENISIDSVSIAKNSPENIDLTVFLSRTGKGSESGTAVSVFSESTLLARGPATFGADSATVDFTLPPGDLEKARISINDNGLPYDNELFFNLPTRQKINVLHITNSTDPYLQRIFTEDEFNYARVAPKAVDQNTLDEQHLVILDQVPVLPETLSKALMATADSGVSILQIPAMDEDPAGFYALNRHLGLPLRDSLVGIPAIVNTIAYDHPLFKGVFNEQVANFQYPEVQSYFRLKGAAPEALEFAGGIPFLYGRNGHYAFSAAINRENTDLIRSALVVPVFYSIGLRSMQLPQPYYTIGSNTTIDIQAELANDQIVSMSNGSTPVIPLQERYGSYVRIFPDDQVSRPGHYRIKAKDKTLGVVSMNLSRQESVLNYTAPSQLENLITFDSVNSGLEQLKSENKVNELWKWFVIFAIAFFLTEMLILKYFK